MEDAINISAVRNGPSPNTVFAQPSEMLECETDDPSYHNLMISRERVQAYQCTQTDPGKWSAENLGMVYAIFASKGHHFPGVQYSRKNIVFSKK